MVKALPLLASSVNLLRWWTAYIPVLAVLAAWSLDVLVRSRRASAVAAAVSPSPASCSMPASTVRFTKRKPTGPSA